MLHFIETTSEPMCNTTEAMACTCFPLGLSSHKILSIDAEFVHDKAAHLHKASTAVASNICIVGLREMPVEAGRVELGQAVHFVDVGVDAVGDRDINQAIVCSQRDSWLGPLLG